MRELLDLFKVVLIDDHARRTDINTDFVKHGLVLDFDASVPIKEHYKERHMRYVITRSVALMDRV